MLTIVCLVALNLILCEQADNGDQTESIVISNQYPGKMVLFLIERLDSRHLEDVPLWGQLLYIKLILFSPLSELIDNKVPFELLVRIFSHQNLTLYINSTLSIVPLAYIVFLLDQQT